MALRTSFRLAEGLVHLVRCVAARKGVKGDEYAESVLAPAASVDMAELSGGQEYDVEEITAIVAAARKLSVEDYKYLAVRRQALLDFATLQICMERERLAKEPQEAPVS
jgi:hypothetical protein